MKGRKDDVVVSDMPSPIYLAIIYEMAFVTIPPVTIVGTRMTSEVLTR